MPYHYYFVPFQYSPAQESTHSKDISAKLNSAKLETLLSSRNNSVVCFYIRCNLEAELFKSTLLRLFDVPPDVTTADPLPEGSFRPLSITCENPHIVPSSLQNKENINKASLQEEFLFAWPTDEPLEEIVPTPEELVEISIRRELIKNKDIRAVVFYCGYVEDRKISPIILGLNHGPVPRDVVSAVKCVAADFLEKYKFTVEHAGEDFALKRACCRATKKYEPEKHFCSDEGCDTPINPDAFEPTDFIDYIRRLPGLTCDHYGGEELLHWTEYEGVRFLAELPPQAIVEISESAEKYLTLCIDPNSLAGESQKRLRDHIEGALDHYHQLYNFSNGPKREEVTVDYVIAREIKRLPREPN